MDNFMLKLISLFMRNYCFRLYVLPSLSTGNKHPSLRSISCETMAKVITGEYSQCINSYR